MTPSLVAVAAVFVFVCGANDGGALVSLAIRHRSRSGGLVLLLLGAAVMAGPAVFGLAVARTFTDRLFTGSAERSQLIFLTGTAAATALVLWLTRRGFPTSITLALIGSLTGAATGLGASPAWGRITVVLAVGAAAPLVGLCVGYLLGLAALHVPTLPGMSRTVGAAQLLAVTGQCLAYAANDGQKMFGVVAVAAAAAGHPGELEAGVLPALALSLTTALVFTAGSTVSLHRIGRGATTRLLAARPWQVMSAEVASSVAVLGTAGLGVPVSMTQSTAGGLVGTAISEGHRRVRWQFTLPLAMAWLVTLPAGFAAGLVAGWAFSIWNGAGG